MDILLLTCIDRPDRQYPDLDRACLLAQTLERFLAPINAWTIHVIAADREMPEIRKRLGHYRLNYRFLPHSDFIDEFPPHRGWVMQQFLKLMAARRIDSPFYLSIDSDHLLTRRTTPADLVGDGRSRVTPEPVAHHARWWAGSAQILGVEPVRDTAITISCVAMATAIVRGLLDHLESVLGDAWMDLLIDRDDWVDYALYYTYVNGMGLCESTHEHAPILGVGQSVWHPGAFDSWDAAAAFAGDHHFVCVQSNTEIPPSEIARRIAPHLRQ